MKKDLMAREAARLLEGSSWLPQPLRLDVDDAVGEAAEGVTDGVAAELPAFLTDDTGTPPDEPVTVAAEEPDHLQAAE
jgi:ParB family chromosome partitioning protein